MAAEQLNELKEKMEEARGQVNAEQIQKHLDLYYGYALHFPDRLKEVTDLESFRNFRREWQACSGIAKLPKELAMFHTYLTLVEQYNAQCIALWAERGPQTGHAPVLIHEDEFLIMQEEAEVYKRPFHWDTIKKNLVGESAKTAAYIHAVAVLQASDVIDMIEEGYIKWETIQKLPFAVSERGVNCAEKTELYQMFYHSNLTAIYNHFGYDLPRVIGSEQPLKGVTFDGRADKIRYILSHVNKPDGTSLSVKAEKYLFEKEDVSEPAIRVVCTIPGDKTFQKLDIGNLPRETALMIDEQYPDATLILDIKEMGIFETETASGKVENPFAKLRLQIACPPVQRERDLSEEMDALFDKEMLG